MVSPVLAAALVAVPVLVSTMIFYCIAKSSLKKMHLLDQSSESAVKTVQEAVLIKHEDEDVDEEDLECAVCLNKVRRGERYEILEKCCHGFHGECIEAWLQHHSTCPLCRSRVPHTPLASNEHPFDYYYRIFVSYSFSVSISILNWMASPLSPDNNLMPSQASQDLFYF